jgi:hypothetical protein
MLFENDIQSEFLKKIDGLVINGNYLYIEAIIELCEEYDIEPQIAAKFLTQPIIEKIEKEGMEYNLLSKKSSELPV